MDYTKEQIEAWKAKAEKWDKLDAEIAKFYVDENEEVWPDGEEPGDLVDIGEAAARAFGYF